MTRRVKSYVRAYLAEALRRLITNKLTSAGISLKAYVEDRQRFNALLADIDGWGLDRFAQHTCNNLFGRDWHRFSPVKRGEICTQFAIRVGDILERRRRHWLRFDRRK